VKTTKAIIFWMMAFNPFFLAGHHPLRTNKRMPVSSEIRIEFSIATTVAARVPNTELERKLTIAVPLTCDSEL
jgi:hypothetical protein